MAPVLADWPRIGRAQRTNARIVSKVRLGGIAILHIATSLKDQHKVGRNLGAHFTPNQRLEVKRLGGHWRRWVDSPSSFSSKLASWGSGPWRRGCPPSRVHLGTC